jgi:hypothetical protein
VPAGATVHVEPGVYREAVVTVANGRPEKRIRYVADVKWGAKILTRGVRDIWINKGEYVTIEGFDISGDGAYGIRQLASYGRVVGNRVHHIPAAGCSSYGGAGIFIGNYAARDTDTIGNVVHDIGDPDIQCYRVHGIYHANTGGRVFNNVAYRNQAWGINLWHAARDVLIANNLLFENGEGGISVGAGDAPGGTASGVKVNNNISVFHRGRRKGHGIGIREHGNVGRNTYSHNLLFGNHIAFRLIGDSQESGNVIANPKFREYKPNGSGNYQLQPDSPGLRAGNCTEGPDQDISGARRPKVRCDIGPYQNIRRTELQISAR